LQAAQTRKLFAFIYCENRGICPIYLQIDRFRALIKPSRYI